MNLEAILDAEKVTNDLGIAPENNERVPSVIDIEPTVPTVETQAHRKPSINRIPALSSTPCGGSSEKITASPHAVPSSPQRYCHGNNAFCRTPLLVRITLPVLRSLRGKDVETWSRQPTDRHSVLLGLMSNRAFYYVAWPLLGHTAIHLCDILVEIHH